MKIVFLQRKNIFSLFPPQTMQHFLPAVHTLFCLAFCIYPFNNIGAQTDTLDLPLTPQHIRAEDKGNLSANIDALAFMRDNEYESVLTKGYTLPGFWLAPTLTYQPLKNLKIELGVHMLHFWGADNYPKASYGSLATLESDTHNKAFHCIPIFRANIQLSRQVNVVLGTLYGKTAHHLIEPLYNEELDLSADPETGLQLLVDNPAVKLDAWVNWENFIFKGDDKQESFTFGLSTRFLPSRRHRSAQWYIPVQAVFHHIGGEINTEAQERGVKTWLNTAVGAGINIPLATRLPVHLQLESTLSYFSQRKGEALPYDNGYGVNLKAAADIWKFKVSADYWHGDNFISIFGNPFYSAYSLSEDCKIKQNNLASLKIEYNQQLGKNFSWGGRAAYYHLFPADTYTRDNGWQKGKSSENFSVGVFIRMSPNFLIKKFK